MSKHETPLTRRYWQEIGGTLVEEFLAIRGNDDQGKRLIDGIIILNGPFSIARTNDVDVTGKDVVVIQTKAHRLGMYLLGQALFSKHLIERFHPRTIETVAICTKGDAVLGPIAAKYGIKVVVYAP